LRIVRSIDNLAKRMLIVRALQTNIIHGMAAEEFCED
jgi:hypothetical protein